MSEQKKTRKNLSIQTKLQLLADVDKKQGTKKEIAEKYGIPHNTLSTIVKNRAKLERPGLTLTAEFQPDRKRQRTTEKLDIDQALFLWFKQARAMSAPISNPVLTSQAELTASELGLTDFTASVGWIERFKRRHGIALKTVSGEAAAVDHTVTNALKQHDLPSLLNEYGEDIFNADETGIFYKCLPDKSLALKGERCTGGKKAKERMTALVAANMSSKEKLPLVVIGKSLRPRCMKNVKNLPVDYTANKKAWMTSSIFENWLRKFVLQCRSVAMVVDNCPAHPHIDGLRSIKLVFLPPNTTSHLQPCDQGIINSLKHHYQARVVRKNLDHIKDKMTTVSAEPTTSETFRISVLDALCDLRSAWDKVTEKTIKNCFRHAGFCKEVNVTATEDPPLVTETDELENAMESLAGVTFLQTTAQDFVSIDVNVETTAEVSVSELVQIVQSQNCPESESDEEMESQDEAERRVTAGEARAAIATLRRFAAQQEKGDCLFSHLSKVEDKVEEISSSNLKQKLLLDFFQRV